MPKQPLSRPRYMIGETVESIMKPGELLLIEDHFWNGLTHIYRFYGNAMSCGEQYLRHPEPQEPRNYVAVMQIAASKFAVKFYSVNTSKELQEVSSKDGVAVSMLLDNEANRAYCEDSCKRLNK